MITPIHRAENLTNWYITAGDRAYLIGAQDGSFPDLGWHVHGEMGGLWTHPTKLLDGFWLQINGTWLTDAQEYTGGPYWQEFRYSGLRKGLAVTRRQFVPDGEPAVVVRYTVHSPVDRSLKLKFLARTDLRGVWLSEMDGVRDGYDHAEYDEQRQAFVCRDDLNPWRVVLGACGEAPVAHESGRTLWGPEQTQGRGISVAMDYTFEVKAGDTITLDLVMAGSVEAYERVCANIDGYEQAKAQRYGALLSRSALTIPDATIQTAWDWVKCNYDWLVRTVPELGTGLGAGVQDYPWWFGCDNSYALFGCLALGQHEVAVDTLDLLRELSVKWNGDTGRVVHECSTMGYAYNPGNAQETPHFIKAVWHTFRWTGDMDFLRRHYAFCKKGLLEYTLGACCPDGDLLPYGYGIIEVEDLNLQVLDTAVYTVEALDALAGMADLMGEPETAAQSTQLRDRVRTRIEEAFWMDAERMYGDIVATPREMAPRLRSWLRQAERMGGDGGRVKPPEVAAALRDLLHEAETDPKQDTKRPWNLRNWVVICPAEAGLAPADRACRMLERVETPEFTGRWGMYLSGIDHTHIMTINTGVLAVAEAAYGRAEQALAYTRKIASTLSMHMPGGIAEMSPDYGCFVQAWSGYGVAWPVVAHIFGLRPEAHLRRLSVKPTFPAGWNGARLERVRIGDVYFDIDYDGHDVQVAGTDAEGRPLAITTRREDGQLWINW
ncbi:MAG TPA: hypothetical protein VNT75_27050 [Symbiobacteriaceae bacterium]|nr:hypothetical protein [Symbiobacteriaceae bacterium]